MRLFVALPVSEPARREVRRRVDRVRDRLPRARWVDFDALHLTLLFLGEVAAEAVPPLAAGLGAAFARCPPLDLRLGDSLLSKRTPRSATNGGPTGPVSAFFSLSIASRRHGSWQRARVTCGV